MLPTIVFFAGDKDPRARARLPPKPYSRPSDEREQRRTINAMGAQVETAAEIVEHEADYHLPLKGKQPTLSAEVGSCPQDQ